MPGLGLGQAGAGSDKGEIQLGERGNTELSSRGGYGLKMDCIDMGGCRSQTIYLNAGACPYRRGVMELSHGWTSEPWLGFKPSPGLDLASRALLRISRSGFATGNQLNLERGLSQVA